jgi:hypothetical protein
MLLELGKAISFFISLLSLYPVLFSAFFVLGAGWEERLFLSLDRLALSGCICFASGLLFVWPASSHSKSHPSVLSTPPVILFFFAIAIMALLFLVAWYLDVYYVPHLWRNEPG